MTDNTTDEAWTPSTEDVRRGYSIDSEDEYSDPVNAPANRRYLEKAFDRWLAAHDAEVLASRDAEVAEALKAGAAVLDEHDCGEQTERAYARAADAEARVAALEAVIQNARDLARPTPNGEPLRARVSAALALAPSAVLDALIREKQAEAVWQQLGIIRGEKAEAWDEGREAENDYWLQREGRAVPPSNPYRSASTETPACETCGNPATYRLGLPQPSWCDAHGPQPINPHTSSNSETGDNNA